MSVTLSRYRALQPRNGRMLPGRPLRPSTTTCMHTASSVPSSRGSLLDFGRRRGGASVRSLATVYLGLGSNVGDRHANLLRAYKGLRELGEVDATSLLYETPPMYVEDQPWFLNAACRLSTDLAPAVLLERLKALEAAVGRKDTARWGPRAVDVDILLYDDLVLDGGDGGDDDDGGDTERPQQQQQQQQQSKRWLRIPHPRMHERPFVLLPLADIQPDLAHPILRSTVKELLSGLGLSAGVRNTTLSTAAAGVKGIEGQAGESAGAGGAERVLPMGVCSNGHTSRLWPMEGRRSRTYVMGILNATPDSFSDGGQHYRRGGRVATAVEHALKMVRDGADVLDIGGESTRQARRLLPGAAEVSPEEEISRVVPVIEGIRAAATAGGEAAAGEGDDADTIGPVTISVDTRRAAVAEAAVAAGADAVNDVSGGTFDPRMLATVARAGVPLVMMHMRGTPQTMTSLTDYGGNVVGEVSQSLEACSRAADIAGVPRWMHVLDPGIGFAKTHSQSLLLMRELDVIAKHVGSPLLVGPSRKRFIGELTSKSDPIQRDWGTVGACCSAAERGAKLVRVHNVQGAVQALAVSDAIRNEE
ncbi:unnamed protein product [Ectocarpus sp. 4 AP-2014]